MQPVVSLLSSQRAFRTPGIEISFGRQGVQQQGSTGTLHRRRTSSSLFSSEPMGRKSKNAAAVGREVQTYHERRALGFGTKVERLGADAQGSSFDCNLTFAPAVDPVW